MDAVTLVLKHNNLEQTVTIVSMLLDGKTQKQISSELGVAQSWVSRVKSKYILG